MQRTLEDVSLTFTDKTEPFHALKREDYWRNKLKTNTFFTNMLSICIFIGPVHFEDKDCRTHR